MGDTISFPRESLLTVPVHLKDRVIYQRRGCSPKDIPEGKRYCLDCEAFRDIAFFTSKTGKLYTYCRDHRNKRQRDSYTAEKGVQRNLQRLYKLSKDEYDLMLFRQGGVCACCYQPETLVNKRTGKVQRLSLDHHHGTNTTRELLCNTCNVIVEYLERDRDSVRRALEYLERHDI